MDQLIMRSLVIMLTLALPAILFAETKLVQKGDSWNLILNGKPYFVKGGGGQTQLEESTVWR